MQYSCTSCNKSFISKASLSGHKRMHGASNGKLPTPMCCCLITKREIEAVSLASFQARIKYCQQCNTPLDSYRKFCNTSCAASFNNKDRVEKGFCVTDEHKKKTSESLIKKENRKIIGDYCKLYISKCTHCGKKTVNRNNKKYCVDHQKMYSAGARVAYKFTFDIYEYPDLFDIKVIQNVGLYNPIGNPAGLSKDHKISVSAAIKNGYDIFYIKHPINCEMMPIKENIKKRDKCSISYDELVFQVDQYELSKQKN